MWKPIEAMCRRRDVTTLGCGAVVNAADSQMLGCFRPLHNCEDNRIHSAAGLRLRSFCNEIMEKQGHDELTYGSFPICVAGADRVAIARMICYNNKKRSYTLH